MCFDVNGLVKEGERLETPDSARMPRLGPGFALIAVVHCSRAGCSRNVTTRLVQERSGFVRLHEEYFSGEKNEGTNGTFIHLYRIARAELRSSARTWNIKEYAELLPPQVEALAN